jgi:branched-chain amino acid transport system substrate-binding protein
VVNGITLYFDEVNSAGGVAGMRLVPVVRDDGGVKSNAVRAVTDLIVTQRVSVIVGSVSSGVTEAAAPIAQQRRVPLITPCSSEPSVTSAGSFIFNAGFTDSFQGYIAAKYAIETLGARTAACLFCSDYGDSAAVAESFATEFTNMDRIIVAFESYPYIGADWETDLEMIAESAPEVLLLPDPYYDCAPIVQHARELGIDAWIIGTSSWSFFEPSEHGDEAFEGALFVDSFNPKIPLEPARGFTRAYRARFRSLPDVYAALGYETAMVLVEAIRNASSPNPAAIRDALEAVQMEALLGWFCFDSDRNAMRGAVIMEFLDGSAEYRTTVDPGYG